jgi:hypothetical protein
VPLRNKISNPTVFLTQNDYVWECWLIHWNGLVIISCHSHYFHSYTDSIKCTSLPCLPQFLASATFHAIWDVSKTMLKLKVVAKWSEGKKRYILLPNYNVYTLVACSARQTCIFSPVIHSKSRNSKPYYN